MEIACPSDCAHLESHGSYQRRRTLDRVPPGWLQRIMWYEKQDPSAQEIVHEIQLGLCLFARERGALELADARAGLEFARERMSPIETPASHVPPLGDSLVRRLDGLIQARALVEREGVRQVLDEILEHLDSGVPADRFADFLKFLRALYGDHLGSEGRRSRSHLIVPR